VSFPCGLAFKLAIEGIRNVHGRSHLLILPYLWLVVKLLAQVLRKQKPELEAPVLQK